MKNKYRIYLVIITILFIGIIAGFFISNVYINPQRISAPVEIREDSNEYKYINPLIFSRTSKGFYAAEFKDLTSQLNTFVKDSNINKNSSSVSIYFRDLNSGHWTGVNEDENYEPSSLLKVVLMVTYLKESLKDKNILSKKIYYKGLNGIEQYYKPTHALAPGYYTVSQLIDAMILDSDNAATEALIENDSDKFQEVYKDFRLPFPPADQNAKDYMSSRSYSVIFRTLYNSTYLTHDLSEKTLDMLSKVNFSRGINIGIPKSVVVSHKFGEHTYKIDNNMIQDRELHDCGIVYYPGHPYLVCIMTKGSDFSKLEGVISKISQIIYNYVDIKYKK